MDFFDYIKSGHATSLDIQKLQMCSILPFNGNATFQNIDPVKLAPLVKRINCETEIIPDKLTDYSNCIAGNKSKGDYTSSLAVLVHTRKN